MRNRSYKSGWLLSAFLILAATPAWAQSGRGRGMQCPNNNGICPVRTASAATQTLTATETEKLVHMREEEKLAHDVYASLYEKWGMRIFDNISQSEARHEESIALLLKRYGLADPAEKNGPGRFQNEEMQGLYNKLIGLGDNSLVAAFGVGATIEDLDIYDLEVAAAETDNEDLKLVYSNLLNASKNHMQAFVRQLEAAGDTYTAQYISPEALSDILAGSKQAGRGYGARGGNGRRGMGRGNGRWAQL
jgi:hypothetical protein